MEEIDHVDGSVCTFVTTAGLCSLGNQIRTAYAGEIPDFTTTTAEQVDEWIGSDTYHTYINYRLIK